MSFFRLMFLNYLYFLFSNATYFIYIRLIFFLPDLHIKSIISIKNCHRYSSWSSTAWNWHTSPMLFQWAAYCVQWSAYWGSTWFIKITLNHSQSISRSHRSHLQSFYWIHSLQNISKSVNELETGSPNTLTHNL